MDGCVTGLKNKDATMLIDTRTEQIDINMSMLIDKYTETDHGWVIDINR